MAKAKKSSKKRSSKKKPPRKVSEAKNLVIVESPAKAKTINKFLGKDYQVEASMGHVRDLPKSRMGVDLEKDFTPEYIISPKNIRIAKHLKASAEGKEAVYLATDPDREGEAISWHLEEVLRKRKVIKKSTKVERVVFNAVTKTAILKAMDNPRQVDQPLVDAYLARRALD